MVHIYALLVLIMSLAGFITMWVDKKAARKHRRRIPEKVLFGIAIFGGALGSYLGMRVFHHKTRHKRFSVGLPILMLVQITILIYLYAFNYDAITNHPSMPWTDDFV